MRSAANAARTAAAERARRERDDARFLHLAPVGGGDDPAHNTEPAAPTPLKHRRSVAVTRVAVLGGRCSVRGARAVGPSISRTAAATCVADFGVVPPRLSVSAPPRGGAVWIHRAGEPAPVRLPGGQSLEYAGRGVADPPERVPDEAVEAPANDPRLSAGDRILFSSARADAASAFGVELREGPVRLLTGLHVVCVGVLFQDPVSLRAAGASNVTTVNAGGAALLPTTTSLITTDGHHPTPTHSTAVVTRPVLVRWRVWPPPQTVEGWRYGACGAAPPVVSTAWLARCLSEQRLDVGDMRAEGERLVAAFEEAERVAAERAAGRQAAVAAAATRARPRARATEAAARATTPPREVAPEEAEAGVGDKRAGSQLEGDRALPPPPAAAAITTPPPAARPSSGRGTGLATPDAQFDELAGVLAPLPATRTGGGTRVPWGAGGAWFEPYAVASARQTARDIHSNWLGPARAERARVRREALAARNAATAVAAAVDAMLPRPEEDDDGDSDGGSSDGDRDRDTPPVGACGHAACGNRPFCIVAALQEHIGWIPRGPGENFFKRRNAETGVRALEQADTPLRVRADVDALVDPNGQRLGPHTRERIFEIMTKGDLPSNALHRENPVAMAERALMTVWGVGQRAAATLVARGVRTVADLRARVAAGAPTHDGRWDVPSLPGWHPAPTVRLGLAHYDDLQHKIPRAEVGEIEAGARAAVAELWRLDPHTLESASGGGPAHARALGSYARLRKAETGDVDMLISPPAGEHYPVSKAQLAMCLAQFLETLPRVNDGWRVEGAVAAGKATGAPASRGAVASARAVVAAVAAEGATPPTAATVDSHAAWMGVLHRPGHPVRRLDVKFYARESLPSAVAYFSGSTEFHRALRQWARASPVATDRARALHPDADSFYLGDSGLVLTRRRPPGGRGRVRSHDEEGVTIGGPLPLTCETDIYTHLGLAYVPPHLRTFDV